MRGIMPPAAGAGLAEMVISADEQLVIETYQSFTLCPGGLIRGYNGSQQPISANVGGVELRSSFIETKTVVAPFSMSWVHLGRYMNAG